MLLPGARAELSNGEEQIRKYEKGVAVWTHPFLKIGLGCCGSYFAYGHPPLAPVITPPTLA